MYVGYLHARTHPTWNRDRDRTRRGTRAGSGTATGIGVESGLVDLRSGVVPL